MRKTLSIKISKPCNEDWNSMTPNQKGRHCKVCKKTVHDFTQKSDEQIVKSFLNKDNICGRFRNNQLNRELVLSRKEKNNYRTFLASSLFALFSFCSQEVKAQGNVKIIQTDSIKSSDNLKGKTTYSILKQKIVTGTVLDQFGIPLPGVNVIIKGTCNGVSTDFDGNFNIRVRQEDTLQFSYLGFKTKDVKVSNHSYTIKLELEEDIMGELVVTVGGAVGYTNYIYTPEELAEQQRLRKLRKDNYFTFYKRKHKERRQRIKNGKIERTVIGKFLYNISKPFRRK